MQKNKKREAGFTLLEMILCLLFLSLYFLLVPRLHSLFIEKPYSKELNYWEWDVFMEQVQLEFREVQRGKVVLLENEVNVLLFQLGNGDVVTYEGLDHNVVRKVNKLGREIALQKVSSISYELTPYTLSIHVQDISGKMYHGVATRYTVIEMTI
ncbi:competence protein ComG [Bacillus pseudomycoides]|uniref:Competence protein ComG n=1 Tax=Bacillus pseudomycoides TaxID=64104 RepID=A0AA91VEN8_9BACI|nr:MULTISPECIES: competence type IV pilus minor pilin ComGF [Bacillus]PEB53328.1 competence protein ComG [Bacillus sp. AFS098217]PED83803.1 competence protein ComG [Bacillus pseudomycoides]PEU14727.1 competence protein ComG [Bacillus sp. AFS019443]PEU19520.1 competence protein ComG [Bacillus sp. AFS014408]PFW64398.1 competence protein ComG [Bacillus sp. AFS075034]